MTKKNLHGNAYSDDELRVKLFDNSKFESQTGCLIWQAGKNQQGYGLSRRLNKTVRTHRLSYYLFKGDIGALHVLHHCDNPSCVNPNHLYLGTDKDNAKDKKVRNRHHNQKKIFCKNGHEFTLSNTRVTFHSGTIRRSCKTCATDYRNGYNGRNREYFRKKSKEHYLKIKAVKILTKD